LRQQKRSGLQTVAEALGAEEKFRNATFAPLTVTVIVRGVNSYPGMYGMSV